MLRKRWKSYLKANLLPVVLLRLAMLPVGCAALPGTAPPLEHHLTEPGRTGECGRFFVSLDREVAKAGDRDWQSDRLAGFPYLRINRFLASFADQSLSEAAQDVWTDRMMALDRRARQAEIANLPDDFRDRINAPEEKSDLMRAVKNCGDLLRQEDLKEGAGLPLLLDQVKVKPDYSTVNSILGLYPLTSIFVRIAISRYQAGIRQTFATPLAELPIHGRLIRYVPPAKTTLSTAETATIIQKASANALAIPDPTPEQRQRLFLAYAPVWEIDLASDADRIGRPILSADLLPDVDTTRPLVYTLLSHTRYHGQILLQLNYVVWFPSRPLQGALDLYGGRLDGLILRVTLGSHGNPIFVDTIHNCGCYHMVFPGPGQEIRENFPVFEEPILAPQRLPPLAPGSRPVIRVASRTHYVERLYLDTGPASGTETVRYELADYNLLRSLPLPNGSHHSLFGEGGIIPGTERKERLLLWPTGVLSPGAMRQWGNHAIAFFGRRHFDDAYLFERFFEPAGDSNEQEIEGQ